ncbi:MAG: glycosyltransferase family 4 protein [Verrucomicrobia bacterium]|nr:MAG: glycosyltransferase family 4 protein [Verrucomicrobiota bacterium]
MGLDHISTSKPVHGKSILLVADPHLPVPPPYYGGIERIVHLLAEGLVERGWAVTLACHPQSSGRAKLLAHLCDQPGPRGRVINTWQLLKHLARNRYDLIHSFAHYDLTTPLWLLPQKQIQSFQAPPDRNAFAKRVRLLPKRALWFTTCGYHMVKDFETIAPTRAIHNGVTIEQFDFQEHVAADAPLVFLGRIEPIKGTHSAIQIAKATGRRLIIAGNRSESPEIDRYFKEQIEPQLSDQITYIGPVDDVRKNRLLGQAAALLMPIEWDEPFGIVMTEALACGTPVIGTARGALPEIVRDGITGRCCHHVDEMIDAVIHLGNLSRCACREDAASKFSSSVIVDQYEAYYATILSA